MEEIFSVEVIQFKVGDVVEKFPPLLGERVGGECCVDQRWDLCVDFAVEANTNVFYVFLPHGDAVESMLCRSYLDEYVDCVVKSIVGVVKRRRVRSYRGASFARRMKLDRITSSSRTSSFSYEGNSACSSLPAIESPGICHV